MTHSIGMLSHQKRREHTKYLKQKNLKHYISLQCFENLFGSVSTSIRTAMGEQFNSYFYRIEDPETNRSVAHIAMIEYSDLVEINKALAKLVAEADTDCSANPDYLENRFVTNDGFEIGYYVSNGKANWYMKLERYSSSTVFVKNAESLTTNFQDAQKKIEELKAVYKK